MVRGGNTKGQRNKIRCEEREEYYNVYRGHKVKEAFY